MSHVRFKQSGPWHQRPDHSEFTLCGIPIRTVRDTAERPEGTMCVNCGLLEGSESVEERKAYQAEVERQGEWWNDPKYDDVPPPSCTLSKFTAESPFGPCDPICPQCIGK